MQGLMDVTHEVRQHKYRELLPVSGFVHIHEPPIVSGKLGRGTGAIGTVLGIRFGRAHGHVVVVPLARSWYLPVELVLVQVEVEGKRCQIVTSHQLPYGALRRWGEQGTRHVSDDAMAFITPSIGSGRHGTEQYHGNQQPSDTTQRV
jgi:hypothetical protein